MPITFGTLATGTGGLTASITGVPLGATIGVLLSQPASGDRTYGATSSLGGGAFTASRNYNATINRTAAIVWLHNAAAGDHTITVTVNTGASAVQGLPFYATGLDTGAAAIIPTGGGFNNTASTTQHAAPVGEIDSAGAVLILVATVLDTSSGAGTGVPGTDYAGVNGTSTAVFFQWKETAAAVTDERGTWSYSGTGRASASAMVALPLTSGGGGGSSDDGWVAFLV